MKFGNEFWLIFWGEYISQKFFALQRCPERFSDRLGEHYIVILQKFSPINLISTIYIRVNRAENGDNISSSEMFPEKKI
jgi:hypothetical protein